MVAVTSGLGTGFFGMPGLAVDLPVLVANTVGLVRRHALVYGFTTIEDSTSDPKPLLFALGASSRRRHGDRSGGHHRRRKSGTGSGLRRWWRNIWSNASRNNSPRAS